VTSSIEFPAGERMQGVKRGIADAFVTKISRGALVYSTYLGGTGADFRDGDRGGRSGSAFVTGVHVFERSAGDVRRRRARAAATTTRRGEGEPAGDALPLPELPGWNGSDAATGIRWTHRGTCMTGGAVQQFSAGESVSILERRNFGALFRSSRQRGSRVNVSVTPASGSGATQAFTFSVF